VALQARCTLCDKRAPWAARQDLAATPPDSRERFQARRDLPALARRMREVRLAQRTALPSESCGCRRDTAACPRWAERTGLARLPAPRRASVRHRGRALWAASQPGGSGSCAGGRGCVCLFVPLHPPALVHSLLRQGRVCVAPRHACACICWADSWTCLRYLFPPQLLGHGCVVTYENC